jgi:hypothetical protein
VRYGISSAGRRLGFVTSFAIIAERIQPLPEKIAKLLPVLRSAVVATEGIYLEPGFVETNLGKEMAQHGQNLGIDLRVRNTGHLHPDLVKLPVTSFLRSFIAEHGAHVV